MPCVVGFPANWMTSGRFETSLRESGGPHAAGAQKVTFVFPVGCKVMVDCAIRLLSLVNQLARLRLRPTSM